MKKFEAMYYPYASVHNKETLKLSSLYFDRIHVLSPKFGYSVGVKSEELLRGNEIYEGLNEENLLTPPVKILMESKYSKPWGLSEKENERWERQGERRKWEREKREKVEYEKYEKKSKSDKVIISEINPSTIYKKYYQEFLNSIHDDLNDENFKTLKHDKKWLLHNEKVAPILSDFREKITWHGDDMLVDADLGESILLNHAIFASMDKKLTPFTDELEHSRLLNHKMQRNFELMKDYLLEEGYIDDIKQNLLAKKVLEINLSGIEGVSYSDILDFRDDNKKELKSFRIEMGKMSTSISSNPWTSEFDSELAQIVKSKIEPKVQDLENQTSEFKDNMIVKYGKKAIPVAITLGATVYAGVPLSLAVVGTTLFDKFVKGDDNIIGSILNDWKDWRHQSRNSLTYLMNLNRLNS